MSIPQVNLAALLIEPPLQHGWGGRVALRQGERTWTYAELADQVTRVASVLRSLDISPGERVAVFMRDSLEAAAAILGTVYMGAIVVPLSELARPLDLGDYLVHSGAVAAIVQGSLEPVLDEIRAKVPSLRQVISVAGTERAGVHDFAALMAGAEPASQAQAVSPDDTALIVYSAPGPERELRGIPHTHATPMEAFATSGRDFMGLTHEDRVFSVARLSTTYGLGTGLVFPLAAGAETVLLPAQPHSEAIFAIFDAVAPTVFVATASRYGQLARDAGSMGLDKPLGRCRLCISGAEGMPPKLLPKIRNVLGAQVTVGYGLTEAFQFVLVGSVNDAPLGRAGRLVPGFDARIIDDDGNVAGTNEIGTLQLRGPTVLRGYWGSAQDDEQFAGGWFTTRDRFMADDDGNYYHCGRVDDLFKVGGKWVSPVEVERALLAHEAVWDCAVIGADDEDGLLKPYAFVVANIGHDAGEELETELRQYVKDALAPYKYPRWFEFCDRLPKGPSGKVLRYKLKPRRAREVETASS